MAGTGDVAGEGEGRAPARSATKLRRASLLVLAVLLTVTGVVTWLTDHVVGDQEHKLLAERSGEISLILQQTIASISTEMTSLGRLARMDPAGSLFNAEATADLGSSTGDGAIALLVPAAAAAASAGAAPAATPGATRGAWQVSESVGHALTVGQLLTGAPAATARQATVANGLVATPVYGSGPGRSVGFAVAASPRLVVYRVSVLGPSKRVKAAPVKGPTAHAFSDVSIVLYASARVDPAQVILHTSDDVPLEGTVAYSPYMAGKSEWLLGVQAAQPLVGSVAADAPWAVLGVGLVGAGLVFFLAETVVRRRNSLLQLYRTEHRFAETLQRRLLSPLVSPPGLDVASRYVAASDLQQVGGDWFDVFNLDGGRVGVVIGDVMGHDVEAAAAMAQVRAGLRAYALEGGSPGRVLSRLARLVDAFEIALIVTLVYGIIEPAAGDGSRSFRWANAGHLPPLLHLPDGGVTELLGGTSPVLGAPCEQVRSEATAVMPVGSTIVLYTDGLVEVQGVDLSESLESLSAALAGRAGEGTAEEICEAVLQVQQPENRHDDIALVAVQVEMTERISTPSAGEVIAAR